MPAVKVKSTFIGQTGNLLFKETVNGNGGQVIFGFTNGGLDVLFRGTTSTNNCLFDESANTFVADGIDFRLNDSDYLKLGDSTDASLCWDSAKIALTAAAASTFQLGSSATNINTRFVGTLIVGSTGKSAGKDVTLYGTTAANYVKLTAASNKMSFIGVNVEIGDGESISATSVASNTFNIRAYGTAYENTVQVKNSTGNSATKLGFFGVTPAAQVAVIAAATTTILSNTSKINAILTGLKGLGLFST